MNANVIPEPRRRRGLLTLAPLLVVGAPLRPVLLPPLCGRRLANPLGADRPGGAPLDLPALAGGVGLTDADLRQGHVSVVNIFASWCLPCHEEHPVLLELAADKALAAKGVRLIGVAQKDDPENIRRFLGAKGDPYASVGLDRDGRTGIDWGVYGVPETFIVKGDGTIAYKFVGPMTEQTLAQVVEPEIRKAMN